MYLWLICVLLILFYCRSEVNIEDQINKIDHHQRVAHPTQERQLTEHQTSSSSHSRVSTLTGKSTRKHHHIHNQTSSSSFHTTPTWLNYKEVHGLRNQDLIMIITSTASGDGRYLRYRVIPSARTWARLLVNVFVVVEDSMESRFYFRHCQIIEYLSYTTFKCPHEPYYILTRNCTNEYYAADGICCKVDEAIQFLVTNKADLYAHMKYLILTDDDTYWRVDQMMNWLSYVDRHVDHNLPIVGNGVPSMVGVQRRLPRNKGVFHIDGCKEIFTNGWYQPMMMNRRAVDMISSSTSSYSIRSICREFDISQDLGLGIFFWLFKFYHIYIPGVYTNPNQRGYEALKPDLMAIHAVRSIHEDGCDGQHWPLHLRYNQHMMTGCGRIDTTAPAHNIYQTLNMYDAWNWFAVNGSDVLIAANDEDKEIYEWIDIDKNGTYIPLLVQLDGYNMTQHSVKYNISREWTPFTLKDCIVPGKIANR